MGASEGKLSKSDLKFLEENTNFDRKSIQQWYKGFKKDCPSLKLDKGKFKEVYSQLYPGGDASAFCDHAFRTFDSDHSGTIDFKEFLMAVNVVSMGTPEQKLDWAFSLVDVDGNGTVDKGEVAAIVRSTQGMIEGEQLQNLPSPEEVADAIFAKMDANGDGVLTKQEFLDGCMADQNMMNIMTMSG